MRDRVVIRRAGLAVSKDARQCGRVRRPLLGESTRVRSIGMRTAALIAHDRPLALPEDGGSLFIDFSLGFSFLFFTSSTSRNLQKHFSLGYIESCFPGVECNPFST